MYNSANRSSQRSALPAVKPGLDTSRGHAREFRAVPEPILQGLTDNFGAQDTLYKRYGKRIIDVIGSLAALVLFLPIFPFIVLGIKLTSPGPILYRSIRLGKGKQPFAFYKFRSMVDGAHESRKHMVHLNEVEGPVFKISNDPRVTRLGAWLRRTSVDEVPQLWNVLKGDMTLVGPRPPIPEEVEKYEPWQKRRLDVKPGITCLWQISGRSNLGFDEWMRLDIQYIQRQSFQMDAKILMQTIPAVVSRDGAY